MTPGGGPRTDPDPVVTQQDLAWHIADGDGSVGVTGGIGQWALVMARLLEGADSVPIAVFNGSEGSKSRRGHA